MTSRTTEITLAPADPIATVSPPSAATSPSVNAGGRLRETAIRGLGAVLGGTTGGSPVVNVCPEPGLGDRPGGQVALAVVALPQRDVDGPVVARGLGELAGAVERVDDPDPVAGEPDLVVLALLGQHGVARPVLGEQLHDQLVGGAVAGVLELAALEPLLPDLEQAAAGGLGHPAGQHVVVGVEGAASRGRRSPAQPRDVRPPVAPMGRSA